ncbi:hypothetical protein BC830DRAFT_1169766 [Chytriomyces sp. MP71]|nr:hypothetical protein BC830DRAFT_1169766 [Chytriomyces sp. MP71]
MQEVDPRRRSIQVASKRSSALLNANGNMSFLGSGNAVGSGSGLFGSPPRPSSTTATATASSSLSSSPTNAALNSNNNNNIVFSVPINPRLIEDIETNALQLARDIDRVISNFEQKMVQISSYARESVQVHNSAVHNLCNTIDATKSNMLALITTVDQLSEDMAGIESLSLQIKALKEALDVLEKLPVLK